MPNTTGKAQNKIKRLKYLLDCYRPIFIFCVAISILHLTLGSANAYELQFGSGAKKIAFRWRGDVINLTLSNSLRQPASNIKPNSDVVGAVQRSLKTWENAANIKFLTVWSDKLSISRADGAGDGASLITISATPENVAPFQGTFTEMPGRTRTFYDKRGRILEADIVLNPYQQFSTDGTFGTFDLESALTHEIGHLLGLDHSVVPAATMFSQQGKNGTLSLTAFAPRSLTEDDLAGVRTLYGAKLEDTSCCGTVAGTIINLDGQPFKGWQVWAEDAVTGKLFAVVTTKDKGTYNISGLPNGKYQIITQSEKLSAEILGQVQLETGKTVILNHEFASKPSFVNPMLIGYNGQLSTLAVPLSLASWQTIFLSGESITLENLEHGSISTSSPLITISQESLTKQDFDLVFPVISFNLLIESNLPTGEYNLQIQDSNGNVTYLVGCLAAD